MWWQPPSDLLQGLQLFYNAWDDLIAHSSPIGHEAQQGTREPLNRELAAPVLVSEGHSIVRIVFLEATYAHSDGPTGGFPNPLLHELHFPGRGIQSMLASPQFEVQHTRHLEATCQVIEDDVTCTRQDHHRVMLDLQGVKMKKPSCKKKRQAGEKGGEQGRKWTTERMPSVEIS